MQLVHKFSLSYSTSQSAKLTQMQKYSEGTFGIKTLALLQLPVMVEVYVTNIEEMIGALGRLILNFAF